MRISKSLYIHIYIIQITQAIGSDSYYLQKNPKFSIYCDASFIFI